MTPDENEFEKLINELSKEMLRSMFNSIDQRMMAFQYKEGNLMCYILPLN